MVNSSYILCIVREKAITQPILRLCNGFNTICFILYKGRKSPPLNELQMRGEYVLYKGIGIIDAKVQKKRLFAS